MSLEYKLPLSLLGGFSFFVSSLFSADVGPSFQAVDTGSIPIEVNEQVVGYYQSAPIKDPVGGEKFKGSNFIHPLRTLGGFTITDSQPDDHPHHFGLWWPWKYVQLGKRKILFWELQRGDGVIQATGAESTEAGLIATADYLDRRHPSGRPTVILKETTRIEPSVLPDAPEPGYLLNLEIAHCVVGEEPLTVTPHRYSGFTIRATPFWNKDNSRIQTSAGNDRYSGNASKARWVLVHGDTDAGQKAGFLMMGHPDNQSHEENLRIWDKQHKGAVFVNFNPVQKTPWTYEPGVDYIRKYGVYVFDGEISTEEAEAIWKRYASNSLGQ